MTSATRFERDVDALTKLRVFLYVRACEIDAEMKSEKTKTVVECVYPTDEELNADILEFMSSARAQALERVSKEFEAMAPLVPDGGVLILLDGADSFVTRKGRAWPSCTRVADLIGSDPDPYEKSREYHRTLATVRHGLARGEKSDVMEYVGVRFPNTKVAMLVRDRRGDRERPSTLSTEHCTLRAV